MRRRTTTRLKLLRISSSSSRALAVLVALLLACYWTDVHNRVIIALGRYLALHRARTPIAVPTTCNGIPQLNQSLDLPPLAPNPQACVVYLLLAPKTRDHRSYVSELERSLASVAMYTTEAFSRVIVFTDEPLALADDLRLHLAAGTSLALSVELLNDSYLSLPLSGSPSRFRFVRCAYSAANVRPQTFNYQYLRMNAFRLHGLWRHPAIANYTHLLLLDSDVVLTDALPPTLLDPVVLHGYGELTHDPDECVPGLALLQHFMQCAGLQPKSAVDDFTRLYATYGCLQLARRDFYTSAHFRALVHYLDGLGGVYSDRWSDQSVFYLALQLFAGRDAVKRLDAVKYRHK